MTSVCVTLIGGDDEDQYTLDEVVTADFMEYFYYVKTKDKTEYWFNLAIVESIVESPE